jgi:hypothetical protein
MTRIGKQPTGSSEPEHVPFQSDAEVDGLRLRLNSGVGFDPSKRC